MESDSHGGIVERQSPSYEERCDSNEPGVSLMSGYSFAESSGHAGCAY